MRRVGVALLVVGLTVACTGEVPLSACDEATADAEHAASTWALLYGDYMDRLPDYGEVPDLETRLRLGDELDASPLGTAVHEARTEMLKLEAAAEAVCGSG